MSPGRNTNTVLKIEKEATYASKISTLSLVQRDHRRRTRNYHLFFQLISVLLYLCLNLIVHDMLV
jgi:hypothetical protein